MEIISQCFQYAPHNKSTRQQPQRWKIGVWDGVTVAAIMELQQQIRLLDFKQTPKCPIWTVALCTISQMGRCTLQIHKAARPRQLRLFQDPQLFTQRQLQCRMETPSTIMSFRQPSCRKVVVAWAVPLALPNDGIAPVILWWRHRQIVRLPHCKITETQQSHCSIYSQKIVRMVCSSMGELSCNIALFIFLWSPWTRSYKHTYTRVHNWEPLDCIFGERSSVWSSILNSLFPLVLFTSTSNRYRKNMYTLTCRHITERARERESSVECVVE